MDNRTPKNMQELLRFAIKHQQDEETKSVQIDEDKRIFLDHVLQSMSVNVMEELLKAIGILQDGKSSNEEMADALDLIRDYIDNIDFANSFVKMDGSEILINCVKNADKTVCVNAIRIVAEMSQNNPICQQYFLKHDCIGLLLTYLGKEDPEIVGSSLYALSALIRNFEPALVEFINKDGPILINNCLDIESPRIFSKSCFLLTSISSEFSLVKDSFAKLGTLNKLIKKLRAVDGYDMETEMILNAISVLLGSRSGVLDEHECEYIVDTLHSIVRKNDKLPECEEIVCCSKSILDELKSREEVNGQRC